MASQSTTYSVALCTFNGSRHLPEQLTSILSQTAPPREIVVCDDGSTDQTNEIVKDFMGRFPEIRWKHEVNIENVGVVRNFEKAIGLCGEDLVFLCDQDDVWLPEKASTIIQFFNNNPFSIVFSDARIVDEQLNDLNLTMFERVGLKKQYLKRFHRNRFGMYFLLSGHFVTGATMAFKKKVVEQLLPVPQSPWFLHDGWIATAGACKDEVSFIHEPLILYRQHQSQAIGARMGSSERDLPKAKSGKFSLWFGLLRNKPPIESLVLEFFEKNQELVSPETLQVLRKRYNSYKDLLGKPNHGRGKLFKI
ncbi:MAG TPA: glycosyltransferase family 2 protein [Bacteroidales bacterium]|nr:glycosyltransferase family 2 protein [Bacteroidales bacterium]